MSIENKGKKTIEETNLQPNRRQMIGYERPQPDVFPERYRELSTEGSDDSDILRIREDARFIAKIAHLTGFAPDEITREEVYQLYHKPYGQVSQKYMGNTSSRDRIERRQELLQLAETLLDEAPKNYSYGLFTPGYIQPLRTQALEAESHEHHALLVGAQSPSTINEFSQTIRAVHPNAHCSVIDILGDLTAQTDPETATFKYGDACDMPFPDNSINSLHTNVLLNNLKGDYTKDPQHIFFVEAYRVLSPNGIFVMVETLKHPETTMEKLQKGGFNNIVIQPALEFSTRRAMERALQAQVSDDTFQREVIISQRAQLIIAKK
jgi:hypothetical protein